MTLIDISLPIHPTMPIYPGNQETTFEKIVKPSGSELTTITIDSHAGTHVDAPTHAGLEGTVEDYSLEAFYGPCRVIELLGTNLISISDVSDKNIQADERILFKTDNSLRGFAEFYDTWTAVSPEAATYLADLGITLVGIDWFGIKQKGAPNNIAHTAFLEKNIPILEGIDLSKVDAGTYTLVALPVAFQGIDGAPVRAALIPAAS